MFRSNRFTITLAVCSMLFICGCTSIQQGPVWVSSTGVVKSIEVVESSANGGTSVNKLRKIVFSYEVRGRTYTGEQVMPDGMIQFRREQIIALKVNARNPEQAKIDLPEFPDKSGMNWRRLPSDLRTK